MPRQCLKLALSLALLVIATCGKDKYDRAAQALSELMDWQPGQTIAEIGAGEGRMSFSAAAAVGPSGHVYTTELDNDKLAHLRKEVARRGLTNVTVIKADTVSVNLPDACCDSIFMRRVYHHFGNPAATDLSILRALKPGGYLAVIDFPPKKSLPPVNGAPPAHGTGHGVRKELIEKELSSAGFEDIQEHEGSEFSSDYCIIAHKSR